MRPFVVFSRPPDKNAEFKGRMFLLHTIMSHDLQCELIAKFIISDCPVTDNFPNPAEFKRRDKAWLQEKDEVLAQHISWVDKEQVAELAHSVEAACVVAEKQKCKWEVAEHQQFEGACKRAASSADL